jgi:hypothetical protein
MWVVYDHPRDFPEHFVARVFIIESDCSIPSPVLDHIPEEVRDLPPPCLVRLECDTSDEPRSSRAGFRKGQLRFEKICLCTSGVSWRQMLANAAK